MCLLACFHFSEWYITAVYRPKELNYDSWVINHSEAYTIAQIASIAEYWIEQAIFGEKMDDELNQIWTFGTLMACLLAVTECFSYDLKDNFFSLSWEFEQLR